MDEYVLGVGGEGFWGAFLTDAFTLFAGLYALVQGLENVVTARQPIPAASTHPSNQFLQFSP